MQAESDISTEAGILTADNRLGRVPEFTRRFLIERLADPVAYLRTYHYDLWHQDRIPENMKARYAAVLIPLVPRAEGVQVLLTQRTSHLNGHAGQISFPGGGVEAHDRHREDTALRETEEEIGILRDRIDVLGAMPEYEMNSGFRVTPVIGWIEPPYCVKPDPFEVQDVFEVPLAHFLNPSNYQRRRYELEGLVRKYLAVPYQGRYIWGATAGMCYFFFQLLRG
ncbi:MAG: CoA pyrophosphatase [Betaproteobacteria bacterium]|nr:MAG: CoA pyrophosphatase [Betaproteobacteria bacterium]